MNRLFAILVVTALVFGLTCVGETRVPGENRRKMQERIELLRKLQMMEKLNLDNKTAEKIFEIRRKYLKDRNEYRQELRQDFQKLRKLLNDKPTEANNKELKAIVDNIRKKREKLRSGWERQYEDVSKILTVRQQAELILFLKEFNKSIRALFRRSGPGRPGFERGNLPHKFGHERGFPQNGPPAPPPIHRGPRPGVGSEGDMEQE